MFNSLGNIPNSPNISQLLVTQQFPGLIFHWQVVFTARSYKLYKKYIEDLFNTLLQILNLMTCLTLLCIDALIVWAILSGIFSHSSGITACRSERVFGGGHLYQLPSSGPSTNSLLCWDQDFVQAIQGILGNGCFSKMLLCYVVILQNSGFAPALPFCN